MNELDASIERFREEHWEGIFLKLSQNRSSRYEFIGDHTRIRAFKHLKDMKPPGIMLTFNMGDGSRWIALKFSATDPDARPTICGMMGKELHWIQAIEKGRTEFQIEKFKPL